MSNAPQRHKPIPNSNFIKCTQYIKMNKINWLVSDFILLLLYFFHNKELSRILIG